MASQAEYFPAPPFFVSTSTLTLLSLEKVLVSSAYYLQRVNNFYYQISQFTVIVSLLLFGLDCAYLRTSTYKAARGCMPFMQPQSASTISRHNVAITS
jgi:hypothetical protein